MNVTIFGQVYYISEDSIELACGIYWRMYARVMFGRLANF